MTLYSKSATLYLFQAAEHLRSQVEEDHPGCDVYLLRHVIEVRDRETGELIEEYDYEEAR